MIQYSVRVRKTFTPFIWRELKPYGRHYQGTKYSILPSYITLGWSIISEEHMQIKSAIINNEEQVMFLGKRLMAKW